MLSTEGGKFELKNGSNFENSFYLCNKPERVQPIKSRSEKFKNGYFLGLTNMRLRYILALVSVVYKEIAT